LSQSPRRPRKEARHRHPHDGRHMVPGGRAVMELLRASPERVLQVWMEEGRDFPELIALADACKVPCAPRPRDELESLVGPGLARGVVAAAESPLLEGVEPLLALLDDTPVTVPSGRRLLLALDGVVDPHNLGAVLRSAEFFGASGAFWARDRSAPLSPVAVRSSAGASERLPVAQVTNLSRALALCLQHDVWTVGTVVDGGTPLRSLVRGELPDRLVLVMGSEGRGLRRLTRDRCEYLARIDGGGQLGSLNVSAAAAVALSLLA